MCKHDFSWAAKLHGVWPDNLKLIWIGKQEHFTLNRANYHNLRKPAGMRGRHSDQLRSHGRMDHFH